MNTIPVKDLKQDGYVTEPAYLDGKYIILSHETPITKGLIPRLIEWDYREVLCDGTVRSTPKPEEDEFGDPVEAPAEAVEKTVPAEDQLGRMRQYYEQFTSYVDSIYNNYVTKGDVRQIEINNRIKGLLETIVENRRLVLRVMSETQVKANYLVAHTARSTVLALALGSFFKLQTHRLIELGVACVLHEIGMVRLPPQLYMVNRQLTPQERKSIMAHPIIGYNILKEKQFPLAVSLVALEHHERMNGSGYPRGLSGDKISVYSRIIAVACSYDAVTASRPYKAAKDGYAAMVDILKNEGKRYDDTVIKALVYTLSIYPIGSWVLLTSGKKAVVIDVSSENPRYPIVQVHGEKTPEGKDKVVPTSEVGVRILRPLQTGEIPVD
ncbi:MAG: HD-GYP domain-containing protein [Spirochaetes bacterium]|nr:HD-GYP domain-containing protein [Spirochaetota bacterium]